MRALYYPAFEFDLVGPNDKIYNVCSCFFNCKMVTSAVDFSAGCFVEFIDKSGTGQLSRQSKQGGGIDCGMQAYTGRRIELREDTEENGNKRRTVETACRLRGGYGG